MKKIIFFLLALVIFSACDEIEPIVPNDTGYDESKYGPAPTFSNATGDQITQKVLIEDFTGHTCGNCPAAAIIAEDLKAEYPDRVKVMAIHAGSFADTEEDHYTTDFTCEEGNELWAELNEQINPTGRVNRSPNATAGFFHTQWGDLAEEEMTETPAMVMQIQSSFFLEAGDLNVHVFTEFLNSYEGDVNMVAYITESHIIGEQKDYSQTPELVEDYEFNDVLRASVNGAFGIQIASNPEAGMTVQKDYTFSFSPSWISENSHILAVAFDNTTGQVLNVEEIDILED